LGFEKGYEKGKILRIDLIGLYLRKVLYVESTNKNSFCKFFRSVFEKILKKEKTIAHFTIVATTVSKPDGLDDHCGAVERIKQSSKDHGNRNRVVESSWQPLQGC
jgi:hypothetical protein